MSKGNILIFDDEVDFTDLFIKLFKESKFDIYPYNDFDQFRIALNDIELMNKTKALIFDLARDKVEAGQTKKFEIIEDISKKFNEYRIPIIIHSAFASYIDDFNNYGTVWKVEKSGESMEYVVSILGHLDASGFLETFTPGGIIESNLMEELHNNFCKQFREGEILEIIKLLQSQYGSEDFKKRSIEVFKRTAIRALMAELLSSIYSNDEKIHPIEHYYRRTTAIEFFTGDILISNDGSRHILILTPRCNVANIKNKELLVCRIDVGDFPSKKDKIGYALTDKPEISGYNRFIPPSPMFLGGKIVLSDFSMISREVLKSDFSRIITLSDELTNEIIGKFGAYFFRTGITPWDEKEVVELIEYHSKRDSLTKKINNGKP